MLFSQLYTDDNNEVFSQTVGSMSLGWWGGLVTYGGGRSTGGGTGKIATAGSCDMFLPKSNTSAVPMAQANKGVSMSRHSQRGNCSFTDGYAEARKDSDINAQINLDAGYANSAYSGMGYAVGLVNSRYWDLLQAAGDQ